MNYGDLTWDEAIAESYKKYIDFGPRSSKKIIPIHQWIKETIKINLGLEYEYYANNFTKSKYDKEYKVQGYIYDKKSDITILKEGSVVGVISVKFVSSNYSQNSNNYFENLLGECFNIQSANIPFCHVMIISEKIPYFDKDHRFDKFEHLKLNHLEKYVKIMGESNEAIPQEMCIYVIDIEDNDVNGVFIHPNDLNDSQKKIIMDNVKVTKNNLENFPQFKNKLDENDIDTVLNNFAELIKENIN